MARSRYFASDCAVFFFAKKGVFILANKNTVYNINLFFLLFFKLYSKKINFHGKTNINIKLIKTSKESKYTSNVLLLFYKYVFHTNMIAYIKFRSMQYSLY